MASCLPSRRALSALASVWLAVGASPTRAQPAPGFVPLFDGTFGQATIENGGRFTIENGLLRAEGPEGWLRFPGEFRDVRLRVELRFTTSNGDSGVFLRAVPDRAFARGWPNRSYQVQVLNPEAGGTLPPIGGVFRHGMPPGETLLDLEAVRSSFTGTNEWQLLEIELVGAELTVKLNGTPVTKASGVAEVAGSIGIQSETSAVEFRRIDIEEIEPDR
jgi:hypothetical protein